ncbi:kinase-like domain-containing protein, partial [Kockiozyma suomiensis]|uniref:kinase-like domain-containing protein n=1 Tax=Kockiozyma suomiensis TaxID=1337062 RepID=UPI003343D035
DSQPGKPTRKFSWRNPKPRTSSIRRATSIFGQNLSDETSPASRFLSIFNSTTASSTPDADDEGQEVSDYVIGKTIGYGGSSTVKEAHTLEHGRDTTRAVKIVRKSKGDNALSDLDHELTIWKCIPSHPHILGLLSVHETDFATFCFMEYANLGSVFDVAIKRRRHRSSLASTDPTSPTTTDSNQPPPIPNYVKRRWVWELCGALRFLHQDLRIVHGDIKPENCLLHVDSSSAADQIRYISPDINHATLRLCDFGMAQFIKYNESPRDDSYDSENNIVLSSPTLSLSPSSTNLSQSMTQSMTELDITGSIPYLSPELLIPRPIDASIGGLAEHPVSPKQDIWALGVFTFVLFTRHLPFSHSFLPKLQQLIVSGIWTRDLLRKSVIESGDEEREAEKIVSFVERCLQKDEFERWDISEAMQHEMFVGLRNE